MLIIDIDLLAFLIILKKYAFNVVFFLNIFIIDLVDKIKY